MSYHTIQASELAAYLYCRRAWWLRRTVGPLPKTDDISSGIRYHHRHARDVTVIGWARRMALVLIFLAVGFLTFWLVRTL